MTELLLPNYSSWDELKKNCYVPYSGKQDVCICIDMNGFAHPGVRIESASYPDTISAVQTAIYGCFASGNTPKALLFPNEIEVDTFMIQYFKTIYELEVLHVSQIDQVSWFNPFIQKNELSIHELEMLVPLAQVSQSDFPVACYIQTEFGFITGVNIENTEWRLGLCAERTAIARCLSYGVTTLGELYVFAPKASYCSPCGACRQVITEHLPTQRIHMYHADKTHSEIIAQYLLPHAFSGSELKKRSL